MENINNEVNLVTTAVVCGGLTLFVVATTFLIGVCIPNHVNSTGGY